VLYRLLPLAPDQCVFLSRNSTKLCLFLGNDILYLEVITLNGGTLESGYVDLVQSLSAFFGDHQEVVAAYLFGSRAREQAGPLSDIDIAVLVKDGNPLLAQSLEYRLRLWDCLATLLNRDDIDVVLLNEAPLLLCHRVLQDGILLDCKDDRLRVAFAKKTLRDYLDTEFYDS